MTFLSIRNTIHIALAITICWAFPSFGRIILLNGTSSAGKSSVVREFIRLNPSYKALSIDVFMLDLFRNEAVTLKIIKKHEELLYIEQIREYINSQPQTRRAPLHAHFNSLIDHITESFYDHIVSYARLNQDIIIDDVITLNSELQNFFNKLEPYDVTMVLAYCPFNTLPVRVNKRNKSGDKTEYRSLDSVLSQFSYIYTPTKKKRGIVKIAYKTFDTTINLATSFLRSQEEFLQFKSEMDRQLIQNRKSHDTTYLYLKPRLKYDHIINTAKSNPTKSAISISAYIASHEKPVNFKTNMKKFLRYSLAKSTIEHTAITSENESLARKSLEAADYTAQEITKIVLQPQTICIALINKYKLVLAIAVMSNNEILGIYVEPAIRKLGIGTELLQEIIAAHPQSTLSTSFATTNNTAKQFFTKNNFIKTGQAKEFDTFVLNPQNRMRLQ